MYKLTRGWVGILTIGMVGLTACTGAAQEQQADDENGGDSDGQVTIAFSDWHLAEEVWAASLEEEIARFEEANPGIDVEPRVVSYGEKETLYATQIQAGEGPDVFHLSGSILPFADRDLLQPLDEFIAGEGDDFKASWYPQVVEQLEVDGTMMALPGDFMPMTMFYNSEMLAEAGLDSENLPETWSEWMTYAEALNQPEEGRWAFGTVGVVAPGWILRGGPVLYSHGAQILNDEGTCSALHTPQAREAFNQLAALVLNGFVPPGVTNVTAGNVREQMANRQIAMALGSGWTPPIVDALNPDLEAFETLVTAPVPVAEGADPEKSTIAWLSWWAMNPNTEHPDATWTFMKFLTSKQTEMAFFDDNRVLSARIDVSGARDGEGPEGYDELVNDKFASVLAQEIPNARFLPKVAELDRVLEIANTAMQRAFTEEMAPMAALEQAHNRINDVLGGSSCPTF